ncbi:MAG: FG-GAP-like repeat-containing protein, partial [Acidobacteriota bacterium]
AQTGQRKIQATKKSARKSQSKPTKKADGRKRGFEEPQAEDEFESDPEKRMEWFLRERAYPFESIPDDARRKAWMERARERRMAPSVVSRQWKSIGPKPHTSYFPSNWGLTSGRINAIAVSPSNSNLVLIGGAIGGIWRSTDAGSTFTPVSDTQVDMAVGSIAFAPSNPSIVYAGMGDKSSGYYGTGVLKSTDAGLTWTRVSNSTLPAPGRTSQILVDVNDSNTVYVAQHSFVNTGTNSAFASGFYRSVDGGVNWNRTWTGISKDLVKHPTDPNTYFLAATRCDSTTSFTCDSSSGGVWKTTNAGVNWTRIYTTSIASASNMKVAVTGAAATNIYVLTGTSTTASLDVSTDNGATFTSRGGAFDPGQFSYNLYLFVHPTDANKVYVGTRDLWYSGNGGTNYSNLTNNFTISGGYQPTSARAHPDQHHFVFAPNDPNTIYIAGDGGLFKSTDGGNSFSSLNASLTLQMYVSIDMDPTHPFVTYSGTQDNGTQKRTSGLSWREFATGDGGQVIVDPLDTSIVYTTYVNNVVYRRINYGDTSQAQIGSDTIFNFDRVAFYPPFVNSGVDSTLYFGTYRLYKSTNRGVSWTNPAGATDLTNGGGDVLSAIAISRSNPNVIYVGSAGGKVMVSSDGGANFTNITSGLPTRFLKSITVSPTTPSTVWVTFSGYGTGHVFKSTNSGSTWTDISGDLPNIPVNTLLLDPRSQSTIYLGTDIGVFRSTIGGGTWATFNNGMPPVIVTELDAQPSGIIQAATYGRGMYELDDRRIWMDLDGDQKTDVSVFRANGAGGAAEWWYLKSGSPGYGGFGFGIPSDIPVPADFTGDGVTDIAFYRPGNGYWYVLKSEDNLYYAFPFGNATDTPVPADYDGDGLADAAVFRKSTGTWYILNSSTSQVTTVSFGNSTDKPAVADYDGDGKADIAVYRANGAVGAEWWLYRSRDGVIGIGFGSSTDIAVPGDYTGDGKADIAFFRPGNGYWYILKSDDFSYYAFPFGTNGDVPSPGDYDNDKKFDAAVFRPSQGVWYMSQSTDGIRTSTFGSSTDSPLPSKVVR